MTASLTLRPTVRWFDQEQRAGELLRQRGRALDGFALTHVVAHRPREAERIDARVIVEAAILGRDERFLQVRRDSRRAARRAAARRGGTRAPSAP